MSDPANYTVGWICAIGVEYVAAQEFLDEEHEGPSFVSPNDTNDYTLGKIFQHNVVIAVLPDGEYGTASAASVATNMLNSFPNVRIGLMVGIGGGVPSKKHDVRLGDVVVSAPRDGAGGVFQYDFGKSIQGQSFQHTRFLNQPPTTLRTAMTGIQAQYKRKGHQLQETINSTLDKNARLRREYGRPQPSTDRLFKAEFMHDSSGCAVFCADNPANLVPRRERTEYEDNPAIHYGLIASANQLMKDALIRDKLAAEKDVLCFEMEAAGLVNHFPCLVIRGICDYSDSHKNKEWQGYAAMVAAAYTKDLLRRIPVNKIEAEKRIGDILCDLQAVAEAHRDIAQRQLVMYEKEFKQISSDKQKECLQLFRLTNSNKDTTYEWYKDHVEARVEGTCEWFLNHENFRKWSEQASGLLLVSADPGCGKSVLARYLIDKKMPSSATTCYFFFKDQDQNTVRQALCALIHQLFSQKPSLIGHAMEHYRRDGKGLINSTMSLWTILEKAVQDHEAGSVIIVLDALDECAELESEDLIRRVESQFRTNLSGHSKLKFLLTSRPYEQILCKFRGLLNAFPNIRIPGEDESKSISQEINHVIQYRAQQLAQEKGLSEIVKNHLTKRLMAIPHRTYLWVYLVFDYLKREQFKKTINGIDLTIAILPQNVYETYEQILKKSKDHPMARRALSVILAASRPLTISEMNIALNIEGTTKSFDDLDLEEDEDFKTRLRNLCGLFVSIHQDKIHFLHQTAREFLLTSPLSLANVQQEVRWQHSITSQNAHEVLAEICVIYLDLFNDEANTTDRSRETGEYLDRYAFLEYSARNWGRHYLKACINAASDNLQRILRICDPNLSSCSTWLTVYWETEYSVPIEHFSSVMISSYFGHEAVVKLLLERDADVESRDSHGRTPLSWAAENGHQAVVKLLVERNADVESKDKEFGQTPLSWAAENGHEAVVKLLLDKDADIESKDNHGRTPLSWAAENGQEAVVKLLLEKNADLESKDNYDRTPLSYSKRNRRKSGIKLLLEKDANLGPKDKDYSQTALSWASRNGHEAVVKQLLDKNADLESKDDLGRTPLMWAAWNGHEGVVSQLLKKSADFESKDKSHQSALLYAAEGGYKATIKLLLESNADTESRDDDGCTPLLRAAEKEHKIVVKLLLEKNANVDCKDNQDRTALIWASRNGCEAMIEVLLEKNTDVESKDKNN